MTDKIMSKRMVNKIPTDDSKISRNFMQINPLVLIIGGSALLSELYLISKYGIQEAGIEWSLIIFTLGMVGLVGTIFLNLSEQRSFLAPIPIQPGKGALKTGFRYLVGIGILLFLLTMSWAIARGLVRYAVEDIDVYVYYLASAVLEELFFRLFLISLIMYLFLRFAKGIPRFMAILVAIILSSVAFALAHGSVYATDPGALIATLLSGFFLGIFLLLYEDVLVTMLAHLFSNLLVVLIQFGIILVQV